MRKCEPGEFGGKATEFKRIICVFFVIMEGTQSGLKVLSRFSGYMFADIEHFSVLLQIRLQGNAVFITTPEGKTRWFCAVALRVISFNLL